MIRGGAEAQMRRRGALGRLYQLIRAWVARGAIYTAGSSVEMASLVNAVEAALKKAFLARRMPVACPLGCAGAEASSASGKTQQGDYAGDRCGRRASWTTASVLGRSARRRGRKPGGRLPRPRHALVADVSWRMLRPTLPPAPEACCMIIATQHHQVHQHRAGEQ